MICTKCHTDFPEDCFHVRRATGKRITQCKYCITKRAIEWQKQNPDRRKVIRKKWVDANYDTMQRMRKQWKLNNPDKVRENARNWMRSHPETRAKNENIRRTRATLAGGSFTEAQISEMYLAQSGKCNMCKCDLNGSFCRDHIMPIKLGGTSDISNIQLLCRPCNSRKGAKHPRNFANIDGATYG